MTRPRGSANDKEKRFVLVIGGGQSGLAAGYYLKQAGIPYLICRRNSAVSLGNGQPATIAIRSRSNNINGPRGVRLKTIKTINAYTVVKSKRRRDWYPTSVDSGMRIRASLEEKLAKILACAKTRPCGEKLMPDLTVCKCNWHGHKSGVGQ